MQHSNLKVLFSSFGSIAIQIDMWDHTTFSLLCYVDQCCNERISLLFFKIHTINYIQQHQADSSQHFQTGDRTFTKLQLLLEKMAKVDRVTYILQNTCMWRPAHSTSTPWTCLLTSGSSRFAGVKRPVLIFMNCFTEFGNICCRSKNENSITHPDKILLHLYESI